MPLPHTPVDLGLDRPATARIDNALHGGAHQFAVDRAAAAQLIHAAPQLVTAAHANRAFVHRVLRHARQQGITQLLDLGAGMPADGGLPALARRHPPEARLVCVDTDPVVVAHLRAVTAGQGQVGVVHADLRHWPTVLHAATTTGGLDLRHPVAVFLTGVLHFVAGELGEVIAGYRRQLAAGSLLVISHATAPADPTTHSAIEAVYATTPTPLRWRTRPQITALFDGLELLTPGVVDVQRWRPEADPPPEHGELGVLAGVGRCRRAHPPAHGPGNRAPYPTPGTQAASRAGVPRRAPRLGRRAPR